MNKKIVSITLISIFMFLGCAINEEVMQTPEVKVEEKERETPQRRPISYGLITSKIEKNITTQQEIIELLGAPNITTIDSEGKENWVYEYIYSRTESDIKETGPFDTKSTVERSVKTLTVIIKFNLDKTVSEYSARASYF